MELTKARSLSPRELALVEAWEADRRRALTLDDVQRDMGPGTTRHAAAVMAARLRAKGFLTLLGRGLYGLVPVASMGVAAGDVAAYLDGLLQQGVRFYLGFDTAAGHYGWYPEAYGRVTLGAPALLRRALRTLDGSTFVRTFQALPSVFDDGVVTQTWHGVRLPVSTPEQTVLDLIRHPELVDGYPGLLRVLERARERADVHRLAGIAAEQASVRTQKRLGWLTERAGWTWPEEDRARLVAGWSPNHRATLGDGHGDGPRRWDERWRLVIDVPERELQPEVGVR
ncbi:MAG TPA: type IV toxin-antitoxin system AbiEi family antitoxin [Chloroflexota bacterium]|nr:type IV toxin-antitoxin system AbiEi family antitoxin [Chloroflexota bacterium]